MKDKKEIVIEFGGFYGSIHADLVEMAIEALHGDDQGVMSSEQYDQIDWKDAHNKYCVAYLDKLEDFMNDEIICHGVIPSLEFICLDSPRFYNYTTDKIIASISEEDEKFIVDAIKVYEGFQDYVKERTTSRDGFIPFYTFEEVMSNKDDKLIQFAMAFICDLCNEDELLTGINELNVYEAIM